MRPALFGENLKVKMGRSHMFFLESISNAKPAMVVSNLCIGQNLFMNLIITLLSKAPLTATVQQIFKPCVFILNSCASRQIFKTLEDPT